MQRTRAPSDDADRGAPQGAPGSIKRVLSAAAMLGALGACSVSPPGPGPGDPPVPSDTDAADTDTDADVACDVHEVFARNQCTTCHSDSPELSGGGLDLVSDELALRLVGRPSRNATCPDAVLVDVETPGASMLLRAIAPARYADFGSADCLPSPMPLGTPSTVSDADVDCVEAWIAGLDAPVDEPDPSIPGDPFTVLTRAKMVLHGGAITLQELAAITAEDGTVDESALAEVIEGWMKTPSFRHKRRVFLRLALQQHPADEDYFYQFRNTHVASTGGIVGNFRDSAVFTAERIIDRGEDFRTIVTTNEWEVTTLLLLALKMADNPHQTDRNRKNYPGNDLKYLLSVDEAGWRPVEDAADWRTVTLVHHAASTEDLDPYTFETPAFSSKLRNIPDGGTVTLRAPRIGFFTQPAFFQNWLTNPDNQYRVTVNQTLLVALGKTFSPGDPTPRHTGDEAIDLELFPHGSECYGCHKNLEGMIAPFRTEYDDLYSREPTSPVDRPGDDFAFQGYAEPIATLQDFADATASHPAFAKAWVLKLCQWGTSAPCDPNDPTVERLAANFAASGYDLTPLIRDVFSSPLMTRSATGDGAGVPSATVTVARYDHYCHAVDQRLARILEIQGRAYDAYADLCGQNQLLGSSIPTDAWSRGVADFHQPRLYSPMTALSFDGLCGASVDDVIRGRRPLFPTDDPDRTLTLMTSEFLGFPKGTARFDEERAVLQTLLNTQTAEPVCADADTLAEALQRGDGSCGMGLSDEDALANIWTIICQSPSLTGVGL